MADNTVSLHRVLRTSPEKVFRAFTEASAMAAWLPPYGFLCTVHEMNVSKGGSYRMSFQNFSTGSSHSFGGEMTTSVWLKKVMGGTEIKIVQEGIPSQIPVEMCYMGWQESLDKLTRLVEPEIPDM